MTGNGAPSAFKQADPCSLVVFGASGDLMHRLLVPALYNLAAGGLLPDAFALIGVGRSEMSDDALREGLRKSFKPDVALANAPESDGTFFKVPKVIER